MADEDVAYLGPSTDYRILKEANMVCPCVGEPSG
jgi:hypothetical protein